MKRIIPLLILAALLIGCEEEDGTELEAGYDWAHITGQVKRADDLSPVDMAFVRTMNHLETTTTDPEGMYDLAISLPNDQEESVTVEIYKEGFLTVSLPTYIRAGETTEMPVTTLELYLDSTIVDTGITGTGAADHIITIAVDPETLSVIGIGGQTSSRIEIEVQDALGKPVDSLHAVQVEFDLLETPGGGAQIYPTTGVTNDSGRVVTTFYAGTYAGVVIIRARFAEGGGEMVLPQIVIYETGVPASVGLVSVEYDSIAVTGVGAIEATTLTFVVRDAGGSPISINEPASVDFEILNPTGGGEYLYPETATTNALGQVSTTLSSGTVASTIQIKASLTSDPSIASTPVVVAIHSGFADPTHFGVYPRRLNFPGLHYYGRIDSIIAMVGDMYANPVPMGTSVYFTSDVGIVQGSSTTDTSGFAAVRLYSGPPSPPLSDPFGHVTAQTVGQGGAVLTDETTILFTGFTEIALLDSPYFDLLQGESATFDFIVSDDNGYPICAESTIKVTTTGGGLIGDTDVTMPDTWDNVDWTHFSFSIYDVDPLDFDPPIVVTVSIEVTSENGNASVLISGQID
jgi:hypothetical protein